jgi:hypothetical protein
MPGKRYSVEQIVATLREAERLQAQGETIAQVALRAPRQAQGAAHGFFSSFVRLATPGKTEWTASSEGREDLV